MPNHTNVTRHRMGYQFFSINVRKSKLKTYVGEGILRGYFFEVILCLVKYKCLIQDKNKQVFTKLQADYSINSILIYPKFRHVSNIG